METRRERIKSMLLDSEWTLRDLAKTFGTSTKIILEDLKHVEKSHRQYKLQQSSPCCESCDFTFQDRKKFSKPSRCPKCKSERISESTICLVER